MKRSRMKKIIMTAAIAAGLTGGAAAAVTSYHFSNAFQPSANSRDLQTNKVVFSDSDDVTGHEKGNSQKEDDLWQKDKNADEKDQHSGKARYMLASDNVVMGGNTGTVNGGSGDNSSNNAANSGSGVSNDTGSNADGKQGGTVYDVVDDKSKADVILDNGKKPSDNSGDSGLISGDDSKGTGDNTGNGDSGNNGGNNNSDNNGSDNNGSNNNGSDNNGSDNNGGNNGTDKPNNNNSTVKDPDASKSNPSSTPGPGQITNKPFKEDMVPAKDSNEDGSNDSVIITKGSDWSTSMLYVGQEIDAKKIFYSLETYVCGKDGGQYLWGEDAWEKYIKIDAVSFDGGKTWTSEFPVTVPGDIPEDTMMIKASYRLKQTDKWVQTEVPYVVERTRLFVLSDQVSGKTDKIDADSILNSFQYPEVGEKINLLRYQWDYIGNGPMTELFPGWMENGKLVPWYYYVSEGRHILEPADKVPLDDKYVVRLMYQWMSDDFEVGWEYDNLCYLQTLTNINQTAITSDEDEADEVVDDKARDTASKDNADNDASETSGKTTLAVPKYVQAIVLDWDAEITTDYLEIPDTVMYIDGSSGSLIVQEGYKVDADNQFYASTDEGLLMNKAETEILAIPYKAKHATIPATVAKVNLTASNQLTELILEAEIIDELPEITYGNLDNCKIVVKDDLLEEFLAANYEELEEGVGNCVAAASEPDVTYTVRNGAMISSDGEFCKVITKNVSSMKVPNSVTTIRTGAFADAADVKTLMMSDNGENVILEKDSLKGSQIQTIFCYSQKQYDSVMQQLEKSGAPENVKVELVNVSAEGYYYAVDSDDDGQTVTLLSVPQDLTEFDGQMTSEDGTAIDIDVIGDGAFANNVSLQWVTLPESVKEIGYQAFAGCTALEGVLIDSRDEITIGNKAWDKCEALRFVGSNAMTATMVDDYDPVICGDNSSSAYKNSSFFYVPTNSEGYGTRAVSFVEGSDVEGYTMESIGETGRMLYGISSAGTPWLALRSGAMVDEQVELAPGTIEIFSFAMAGTHSVSGDYTVNWEDLWLLWAFDDGCFGNSGVSGDITFNNDCYMGNEVFFNCTGITNVTLPGWYIQLGQAIFEGCKNLTTADIGGIYGSLPSGLFSGCDALTDVTLNSYTPPTLVISGSLGFRFNLEWTPDEEVEHVRLHVPEGMEEAYVKAWRYQFGGYTGYYEGTPYLEMWQQTQQGLIDWDTWEYPDDEVVDEAVEAELLTLENRLRTMMGIATVSEPTDFYPYRVSLDGELTLVGAPSDAQYVRVDGYTLDLPDGWFPDYIATGAFSRSSQLQMVSLPETLVGVYTDAFKGIDGSQLTINLEGETPFKLMGGSKDNPFSFGTVGSDPTLSVPEGSENDYIKAWTYPMAGYEDEADLLASLDENLTDEERDEAAADILMPVENRLRAMLGMEQITKPEEMVSYTVTAANLKGDSETAETESESETETSDIKEKLPSESETEIRETDMKESETTESEIQTDESEKESETEITSDEVKETESETESDTETAASEMPEDEQEGEAVD